ncbi:Trk family potassium uptake protein [Tetragenococcus osmophilus]|uniref:K+ transporter Trk n=1 Tax=Tetragenococcus osmophilus TaxID=526944 RepID=A0AA37XJV1_9ENTE|nr:TrkH family potassium uptake protein [Tetragenococcus osmophilus]GMA55249.1 K+ transporter Trk [Alicyclobacillus contaminans]AYW47160.1 Trk family potassium uptake protein [Tetragenococcus osmophilus]GMA55322.1 K+ transporter Trk [Alicyclobacillus contaminans]GMA70985.1 K+ transporter Trk [Tetragenococcus osmophilus]GMA73325.1 K+ transporter Trk [Tetragenococcus osmophilus]
MKKTHLTIFQTISLGFASLILSGAGVLMLPISSRGGEITPFIDSLFTATSAVCVTGLTTLTTSEHWTFFGQAVILLLIEIGGLGFMSIPVFFFVLSKRKISLSTRMVLQESINSDRLSGEVRSILNIIKIATAIQTLGVILLAIRFVPLFGWKKGLWYSLFHAVSSFCNAGFDLFGNSLIGFQNDPWVLTVIGCLIIAGGLGFFVWSDLLLLRFKRKQHLSLHSKIALWMTASLLIIGTLSFFITEYNNLEFSTGTFDKRIFNTIFMAVTPRTAGFYSTDYFSMTHAGLMMTMILMFIGGTSGSTAGGLKTTTFGVLLIKIHSTFKGRSQAEFRGRMIKEGTVTRAFILFFLFLSTVILSTMILSVTEVVPDVNGLGLEYIVFEVISAIGTVGLTMGLTPDLTFIGKVIILLLMFIGRVGVMTVFFSLIVRANQREAKFKYPEETVIIG